MIKRVFSKRSILAIFTLLLLLFYFYRTSSYEHYRGLSKVPEFEDALERKYTKVDKVEKRVFYCKENVKECQSRSYRYHFNSPESVTFVKDKVATSQKLQLHQLPVPAFFKFKFEEHELDQKSALTQLKRQMKFNKISYPIVLKQIHGTFGIDVFTHIEDDESAVKILQLLKDKGYHEIMCEEQIEGDCYRIFIFNKQIIDVICRKAPYVIGDGIHSIQALIAMRNKKQLEEKLFETKNVSETYIQKMGYRLDSILPKGKKLIISTVINMHNGASISRTPISSIPKVNQDIFIKTNEVLDITTSGIDFLSKDITVPYTQNKAKILEVNGTPDTEIHNIVSEEIKDGFNIYEKISDVVFM
jgi:cyanophycin synthetase